jgi:hypothetical protein
MARVTFSLDDETVARLRHTAARLFKPQSQVVREAVRDYAERVGRLNESERLRLLKVLDDVVARTPTRSARAVDAELKELRSARRGGGRRGRSRP